MKKIFYFIASAIVALGAMACQNEVDENINPNTQSEGLSFTATINQDTKVSWEGLTPSWKDGDVVTIDDYTFTYNKQTAQFTCFDEDAMYNLCNGEERTATHGELDSVKGLDGTVFTASGVIEEEGTTLEFSPATALLKFKTTAENVKLFCNAASVMPVMVEDLTVNADGFYYVAIEAGDNKTLSYTIDDVTVKEITDKTFEAGKIYNLGTLDTNMTIANVAALIENAEAGSITLPKNATITGSEILTITKSITINGNGATFTSTAGRAINIDTNGEVNISNMTINCSGERVFNIINEPATVNISGVTATATNYAIMVATSAGAATVNVSNSTLTGLSVVNVAGKGAQVTVTKCTLNCEDNNPNESYGALALYNTADDASIVATECEIYVAGDSYKAWNSSKTGTITISDGEVVNAIAYIDYNNGYSYSFSSLKEAIETAEGDDVIVLLQNAEIAQAGTFNINRNGKELTAAKGFKIESIEGNTVTVIEWNPVASVNGVEYEDLTKAIKDSKGTEVVTLLKEGQTIEDACVISKDSKTFNVADGFLSLKNYANANGDFDVVAVTASKWTMVGNFGGTDKWDSTSGYTLYQITNSKSNNLYTYVATNVELKKADYWKFLYNNSWNTSNGGWVGARANDNTKNDPTSTFSKTSKYNTHHSWGDQKGNFYNVEGTYDIYLQVESNLYTEAFIWGEKLK